MYRLLKVRKSYFCKAVAECTEGQYLSPQRTCTLCTKYFTWESSTYCRIRSYHSSLETVVQNTLKKKKVFKITKTASELLAVTANSTRERIATVTKLKPKHISRLVEQPDTSLDQLHRLKFTTPRNERVRIPGSTTSVGGNIRVLKTVSTTSGPLQSAIDTSFTETQTTADQTLPSEISQTANDGTPDFPAVTLYGNESLENCEGEENELGLEEIPEGLTSPLVQDSFEECDDVSSADQSPLPRRGKDGGISKKFKELKSVEWKSWMSKFKELEMDFIEKKSLQKKQTRLQVLVNCGSTKKAATMLSNFKRSPRSVKLTRGAGRLYDTLLEGLASKGDLNTTLRILDTMDKRHVDLTLKSFCCLFECLAKNDSCDSNKLIEEYMNIMEQKGFKLDDIFRKMDFVRDQRKLILTAIQRIHPDYTPPLASLDTNYDVPLLKDINNYGSASYVTPAEGLIHPNDMSKLVEEQVKNEKNGYVRILNIWCQETDPEVAQQCRTYQADVLDQWEKSLSASLSGALHKQHQQLTPLSQYFFAEAVLKTLNVRDVVKIMLQEVSVRAEQSDLFSPPFGYLKKRLGQKVKDKYDLIQATRNGVLSKRINLYHEFCKEYLNENQSSGVKNTRHLWTSLVLKDQEGPSHSMKQHRWCDEDLVSLGTMLYSYLLKDCKINANMFLSKPAQIVPAFYTVFRSKNRRLNEELKPHPAVTRLFRAVNRKYLTLDVDLVAMTAPPVPWTSFDSGAHLLRRVKFIRPTSVTEVVKELHAQKLRETPNSRYYPCYDSLNQLGSIPWRVNSKVLDVLLEVFKSGGSDVLTVPLAPEEDKREPHISRDIKPAERAVLLKQRALERRRKAENYALWCETLYRLSLAQHFRNRTLWLPHNMDFRGRVYPVAPYLQHMSGDMARSLLCFARGEPLGPDGLDWLKIHLVNLTGLKKRDSIAERLEFANAMIPEILDSARNPLKGRKWWMESEEPWQTLAVCFEIANAIESGDPASYIGHFPVHQDGSCNGLQHYAALGRDAAGAQSVNLSPMDKPQDVYSCVAEIVERNRAKDAKDGVSVAAELEGFIKRKVIKQTVMTTVYGVTKFGARLQIARQLNAMKEFDKEKVWAASLYLTSKTFESLNEMFTSTKEIQSWLTDIAQLISQVRHECVEWVTPLGLPVAQPYTKPPSKINKSKSSQLLVSTSVERPNVMKQRNAFPPNFIHSLDSSHMMLTGLHCERAGITFVSVHDCYWVHPRNVTAMNEICRQQFVALHSEPILEDLSKYLNERFGYQYVADSPDKKVMSNILKKVPRRGTFDLNEVLKSVYFFS